jgi:hypothetical protein
MIKTVIKKTLITTTFSEWRQDDLDGIGDIHPSQIIGTVLDDGMLYLIYWAYETVDF